MKNNYSRWILGTRGFYDNYSIKLKIPESNISFSLNYSLMSPYDLYDPHIKIWIIIQYQDEPLKNIALKDMYPMKAGSFSSEMFFVKIGENILKSNKVKGEIKNDQNSISWNLDLNIEKESSLYPLKYLFDFKYLKNKVATPGIISSFTGDIVIDDKTYKLDNTKGIETHFWGRKLPENWNWGQCIDFDNSDNTLFNAYLFKRNLPLNFSTPDISMFHLFYKGKDYYFNTPLSMILTQNDYHIGYWKFKTENTELKLIGAFEIEYKDFLAIKSSDVNHESLFSHATMFGKLVIDIYKKEGWVFRKIDTISTQKGAYIEFVHRYKDPHVELIID